jgi:hypothetical protein
MLKPHRFRWFLLLALILVGGLSLPSAVDNQAPAQTLSDGSKLQASRFQQPLSLRDRLVVGLRAMSKADLAFVDRVVDEVQDGHLPQRMVDETFFWARKRVTATTRGVKERRPIIYFRPVMTIQARRVGVEL